MKRISMRMLMVSLLAATAAPACVTGDGELDEATESVEQAATGYNIGGLYHYQTDDFDEQCGNGFASVLTTSGWESLPRGSSRYWKPLQASNGTFQWKCGSTVEYSECDDAPARRVRFYWDPYSRRIDMTCYKLCGDGSDYSDCAPY
ncbi:MAG: hypothetical protein WKG01_32590 [Kofleriaceae bacterium]